jgi:DNA-binding transcriptional MerR regulator
MPAPRTENYEPKKVYFKPSEAMQILDCSKYTLRKLTALIPDCWRNGNGWRRYSAKEINKLLELRKKL